MKNIYKLLFFIGIIILPFSVNAEYNDGCTITVGGTSYPDILDDNFASYEKFDKEDTIKIICNDNIKSIYIKYISKAVTGSVIEENKTIGTNGYIHEYVELSGSNKEITIKYDDGFNLTDIYAFTEETPEWVERWESLDKADLMLMSTHGDDEQLFFLGLLPKYAAEGKKIQVVYFTNHYIGSYATYKRTHEQLTGLWTVGIKYYPVFSEFGDEWATTYEEALAKLEKGGYTFEDAVKYEVTQIRKYKPTVVVGHDEKGEYSHGQHILNTKALEEAYLKAMDETYDEESYKLYGTHEISKLYLHLYGEGQIVLDYDTPLEYFGGKTAFEMSQLGFAEHLSQQNTWFHDWIYGENNEITKATQIKTYSPCKYGLYYSSVGEDLNKNDMFENIVEVVDTPEDDTESEILDNIKKTVKDKSEDVKRINKKYLIIGSSIIIISVVLLFILLKGKRKHLKKKR